MLIDSHCHLDFPDFNGEREDVINRARAAGIRGMLTICTRMGDAANIRSIAASHAGIWCSQGVHPHEAEHAAEVTAPDIVALTEEGKVVGIGETGLDFYYEHSPRDIQEKVFRAHIAAARDTGLPVIVHTRDADDETVRILREEQAKGAFSGVIHCFSAGAEVACCALDHGMYISFSGIVTFKNARELKEVARSMPADRMLVETDSPYLAPVPKRGKTNQPAYVRYVAEHIAELRGESLQQTAAYTTENFYRLFRAARQPAEAE
jgi:TatD DNase family protein